MSEVARTIISLGGSLIVPDGIDTNFIRTFKEAIEKRIAAGERFVIIVGGGKTARLYIEAGRAIAGISPEEADWIGIHATRLNARFLHALFGELAYEDVVTDPNTAFTTEKPVIIGAGWKPGWSTDYIAVLMAKQVDAKRVLNFSNTSYVYDRDPKTNPDAKAFPILTWAQYRALIPAEWKPGLSTPFDPVASKEAEALGLEVLMVDGRQLENVQKSLAGESFEGTTIRS